MIQFFVLAFVLPRLCQSRPDGFSLCRFSDKSHILANEFMVFWALLLLF